MALVDEDETAAYCIHSLEYVAQESLHEVPVPGDDESADQGDNLGNAEGQPADNERPLAEDNKFYKKTEKRKRIFESLLFRNLRLDWIETVG